MTANRQLIDDREANERLVCAALEAQEQGEAAQAARQRAEDDERALRAHAELLELFIGVLGHDLRNPMSSISMTVETLLAAGHLDDATRSGPPAFIATRTG